MNIGCDFSCCRNYFKLICSKLPETHTVYFHCICSDYIDVPKTTKIFLKERAVLSKITDGQRNGGSVQVQWV